MWMWHQLCDTDRHTNVMTSSEHGPHKALINASEHIAKIIVHHTVCTLLYVP